MVQYTSVTIVPPVQKDLNARNTNMGTITYAKADH
jgi:hypothetical protein